MSASWLSRGRDADDLVVEERFGEDVVGQVELAGEAELHLAARDALGDPGARADDDIDVYARVTVGEALQDRGSM